jgi:predicted AAA+ superfamily ATPase
VIQRQLAYYLKRDASYYPVLTLTGPRQSGKTVLVKAAFPRHDYVNLEDLEPRQFAHEDPKGFLAAHPGPAIFDEVQRVPEFFSALQVAVDADPTPGRFVLSGSHNFLLMKEVSQSLAGRCGILHLLPLSRAELEGQIKKGPVSISSLLENRKTVCNLWSTIYSGFYPRIHDRHIPPEVWMPDYVQTYLERDVRSLAAVGNLETFGRFLSLAAGRTGQLLNYSSLADDCGISVDTSRRWMSILQASFIVLLLQPHHANFSKRLIRSPKLYFWDTGLACHLLRIREPGQLDIHPLRGALFENYVIAEIAKTYSHHRREPPLFFWRDQGGHEVDLLVEESSNLYPVEIKSGQTMDSGMLEGLRWWCALADRPLESAALVYGGAERQERNGIKVRPWYCI